MWTSINGEFDLVVLVWLRMGDAGGGGMKRFGWLAAVWAGVAGCGGGGGGQAGHWVLEDDAIRVEVEGEPFSYRVLDAAGEQVLSSLPGGEGDGYGPVGWTRGTVSWERVVSPGWYGFEADLRDWADAFHVVQAEREEGTLSLVLLPPGRAPGDSSWQAHLLLSVRPGCLRAELEVEGATPRATAAAFSTPADEGFLGFGERFNRTDQRGVDVWSWAEEGGLGGGEDQEPGPDNPYPNGAVMTYYPVPFFISTAGYGFWLDTTWRNEFNLATDRNDAWRAWSIGPRMAWEVYLPDRADPRPWPLQLIDRFTAATGRPMIPPAWTFGPRRRINRGDRQGEVHEIEAMRDLDLAITGIDDSTHFLPAGSHVGREDELRTWVEQARALGYRVCCYFNPYVSNDPQGKLADLYAEGVAQRYFLEDEQGEPSVVWMVSGSMMEMVMIDFTVPEATAWYQSMLDWAVDLGYSGWMYDFGEYVQPDTVARDGTPGEAYHNLYPVQYHRAAHDHLEAGELAGEWLTFVRSGYTGDSAYSPMVWSGDPAASFESADGLPSMVRAGVNLGVSGAPHWGGDINGFHCTADGYEAADEELLVRWIQQGAMGSNMQDQDACVGVIDGDGRKANIFDDPLAQQAWRAYARLHTRLFPYLYTLAHEAHRTGAPVMRHVFLEHPDRADLAGVDDAYYLGPALYVAPVVARGATGKTVDLPAGLYLDWRDQALVEGGREVTLDAPIDKLPLLLRDGYLVPLLDPAIDTLAQEDHPDVVGPADVDDVYDLVGLISAATGSARTELWDGDLFEASWAGGFAPPGLAQATDPAELATCAGCWMREEISTDLARVRVSAAAGEAVQAGGLDLTSRTDRRVRWDLYLVD